MLFHKSLIRGFDHHDRHVAIHHMVPTSLMDSANTQVYLIGTSWLRCRISFAHGQQFFVHNPHHICKLSHLLSSLRSRPNSKRFTSCWGDASLCTCCYPRLPVGLVLSQRTDSQDNKLCGHTRLTRFAVGWSKGPPLADPPGASCAGSSSGPRHPSQSHQHLDSEARRTSPRRRRTSSSRSACGN